MLKFTYTETSFHLERLAQSLEELVAGRVILAMRVGQSLCVEPITASFLLPSNLAGLHYFETEVKQEDLEVISVCAADAEFVEISLYGTWIAADSETAEGVFVTSLCDRSEFFLVKLWQEAQNNISCVRETQDW